MKDIKPFAEKMKAAQIAGPGAPITIVEVDVPMPDINQVRIKVQACGVCHSDVFTKDGLWPGIKYPRVPGHEVVGVINEIGPGVTGWQVGQRVGVGWHGGHDGTCRACRRGDFRNCENLLVPGISYNGGYQQYMIAPIEALVSIPDNLNDIEAAPLLCAGLTTFNALRRSGALPGDVIAVLGIGGLGHLAIQFAKQLGYRAVAVGRGEKNASLAMQLGAMVYLDTDKVSAATELQKLGGAQVILATVPSSKAMTNLFDGLASNGKLMVIGVDFKPIEITPVQLIGGTKSVQGWSTGSPIDAEDTLRFAELTGVRPMIETYPLERAAEAFEHMLSGEARFRVVLTM
jgi:D-arabinose 1-dehydrogenase-like Zn-dependent alcohol dehydrogenase